MRFLASSFRRSAETWFFTVPSARTGDLLWRGVEGAPDGNGARIHQLERRRVRVEKRRQRARRRVQRRVHRNGGGLQLRHLHHAQHRFRDERERALRGDEQRTSTSMPAPPAWPDSEVPPDRNTTGAPEEAEARNAAATSRALLACTTTSGVYRKWDASWAYLMRSIGRVESAWSEPSSRARCDAGEETVAVIGPYYPFSVARFPLFII